MKKVILVSALLFASNFVFAAGNDENMESFKRRLGSMNYYSMQNRQDTTAYNIRLAWLKNSATDKDFVKKYADLRDQATELKKNLDKEFAAKKPDVKKLEDLISQLNDVQSKIDSLLKEYSNWQDSLKQ